MFRTLRVISGLTLIEMLIALSLSIGLLSLMSVIYVLSNQIETAQSKSAQIQNDIRAISLLLTHDIHQAGNNANIKKIMGSYFVAQTDRFNEDGAPIFSLYKKENDHAKIEIIENVMAMKIKYGINEGHQLVEKNSDALTDHDHVVGVSIAYQLKAQPQAVTGYIYAAL